MPNPGGHQAYSIRFENESDLPLIVETLRELRVKMIVQNVATIRGVLLDAAMQGDKAHFFPDVKDRPLNAAEIKSLQKKLDIGYWNLYGSLYGPDPIRAVYWSAIHEAFSKIPGARLLLHEEGRKHPGVLDLRAKVHSGIPCYEEIKWVGWVPNGAHFFFAPIAEARAGAASRQFEISKKRVLEAGFDLFGGFLVGMRELHHIICIVYDRTKADERERALAVTRQLIDECAAEGWGECELLTCALLHVD